MAGVAKVYIGAGDGALATSLDLTDGTLCRVRTPGLSIAPNGDGTVTLTLPLRVQRESADTYLGQVGVINEWLNTAVASVVTGYGDWVTISVLFAGSATNYTYFDVLHGSVSMNDSFLPNSIARGTLTAVCLPYGRTAPAVAENWFLQSDAFDNAAWTKTNATATANATTAPDGTTTAEKLIDSNTTNGAHSAAQVVTPASPAIANGQPWTLQAFLKAAEYTTATLTLATNIPATVATALFDLSAGTVGAAAGMTATASIDDAGNGWYRCAITGTLAGIGAAVSFTGTVAPKSGNYVGVTNSGIYAWGAQVGQSPRVAPYVRVGASRTWTNGDAPIALFGVGGDADALCQARFYTTAPRIRASRRSHRNAVAADWTPWVDLGTASGASNVVDATRMGGSYKRRSISTAAWASIGTVTLPTGARDKGRVDIFAAVRDNPVVISTPTTLAGTVTDPAATVVGTTAASTTAANAISIKQTVKGGSTGNGASGTASATPATTVVGNFLLACVTVRDNAGTAATFAMSSPPATWVLIRQAKSPLSEVEMWIYARENSASVSTAQTWTITRSAGSATWDAAVIIHEVQNVPRSGVIDAFSMATFAAADVTFSTSMGGDGELVVGFAVANSTGVAALPSLYLGGETLVTTQGAQAAFSDLRPTSGSMSGTLVYALGSPGNSIATVLSLTPTYTTTTGATTNVTTPPTTGGKLTPQNYTARVQAVDTSGSLSNATFSLTKTVANGYGSIAYTWAAGAGGNVAYYRITLQAVTDGLFYAFNTPDSTTAYTVSNLALGTAVAALPATTGAVASFNRFRAVVNGAALNTEVQVTASATWYLLHFGTAVVGSTDRALDGTQGGGVVTIQGYNAGGGAANMEADCLFLPAHDEPSVVVETSDLLASTGLTVAESHRRETHTVAWQAPSGGPVTTVSAASVPAGLFTLAPNENLIGLALATTAGVSDMSLTATVAFQVWQRSSYLRGLS